MIKEIKKGDRFVCVNANAPWEGKFIPGNIYEANDRYSLIDENKVSIGFHPANGIFELHFIPDTYEAVSKYFKLISDFKPLSKDGRVLFLKLQLYLQTLDSLIGHSTDGGFSNCEAGYIESKKKPMDLVEFIKSLPKKYDDYTPAEILEMLTKDFEAACKGISDRKEQSERDLVNEIGGFTDTTKSIQGKLVGVRSDLPPYYDNTKGSLYQIAEQRGWNFYQADAVKRIDRALKKGNFKQDIEKTIALLQLWLKESEEK